MSQPINPTPQRPRTLTLTGDELAELTGYRRGAEQKKWLKANGFKFREDRLGRPRVDREHYESKMGVPRRTVEQSFGGGQPKWGALASLNDRKPGRPSRKKT
jgi:hypothetical protein